MEFNTPTTKTAMYTTLKQIFHYYRVERENYTPAVLTPITLTDMTYTALTSAQIRTKAETLCAPEQEEIILKEKEEIDEQISALNVKSATIQSNATAEISSINTLYAATETKMRTEAAKSGLTNSSILLDKISSIESEKNQKILAVTTAKNSNVAAISSEISALNTRKTNLTTTYATFFEKQILAKMEEIKDEESKLAKEVFKYNNSVSEKEQKNVNNLNEANATLRLKYMEINCEFLTKDQLVDMGYYEDVIACVCGYYNTLSAQAAYTDILSESRLAVYLDDYYEHVVYLYKQRLTA